MTNYREILRLLSQGISQRSISVSCECSRSTVQRTIARAAEYGLSWPLPPEMTDEKIRKVFAPHGASMLSGNHKKPDFEKIHQELGKSGVTLTLLWNEYSAECRQNGELPFMYTQFCKHYRDYAVIHKATMHIERKPAEQMEVDWAGQTMNLTDNVTGEAICVYIFVAVLPYSGYGYVEGCITRNQENWICAHINAYRYFGGVTKILVPDNLKTGVTRVDWYTPVINKSYHDMAEHYGTAVIPARVKKPKDKASVEGTVGVISTWIIAALRNFKFFTVHELNEAILEKLNEFNTKPFQKKPGSRQSVFLECEHPLLKPLPANQFELAQWKICTVAFNYHICVEKMFYSVPYEYIKQKVNVRLTRGTIEVFAGEERVASHARKYGCPGQYTTIEAHMPLDHIKYTQWNAERYLSWARSIGESTVAVIKAILNSRKVEQQTYRACMALLKLSDKYSAKRLEGAFKRALYYTPSPGFKSVQTILATSQDETADEQYEQDESAEFSFTRGSGYYGGEK